MEKDFQSKTALKPFLVRRTTKKKKKAITNRKKARLRDPVPIAAGIYRAWRVAPPRQHSKCVLDRANTRDFYSPELHVAVLCSPNFTMVVGDVRYGTITPPNIWVLPITISTSYTRFECSEYDFS